MSKKHVDVSYRKAALSVFLSVSMTASMTPLAYAAPQVTDTDAAIEQTQPLTTEESAPAREVSKMPVVELVDITSVDKGEASLASDEDISTLAETNESVASAMLKAGSTLTPSFEGTWTAVTDGDRTFAQGAPDSSVTLNITDNGFLIFDWKVTGGAWNDAGLTFTATCGDTTLGTWTIKGNSSTSKAWATKCLKISEITEETPVAVAVWTYGSNSATYQNLDEVRLVTTSPVFEASATEGGVATVNGTPSATVDPGTTASFDAEPNEGAVFVGWKTSTEATEFVSRDKRYSVTAYDDPVSLVAVFETPFDGSGTAASPFQVKSQADLEKIADLLGSNDFDGQYFALENDITTTDFSGISGLKTFAGALSGNNHTVSGLTGPLFASISDHGSLSNIAVSGDITSTSDKVGIAVGSCKGILENVSTSGSVTSSGQYVGGLAGYADNIVQNCSSSATVTCTNSSTTTSGHTGGLVGQYGTYNKNGMSNSFATGAVSGAGLTGGLVGDVYSTNSLNNCYATGNVTGRGYSTGGLVGKYDTTGPIQNCYATGNVTGTKYVGGLIGSNEKNSASALIDSCYATGTVTASTDYAGGIIGYTTKAATISNCTAKNASVTSAGANAGRIAGDNVTASWGGATTLTDNTAVKAMSLSANGAAVVLADTDKGGTTIHGADYIDPILAAALKAGSTLEPTYEGEWTAVTDGDRAFAQGASGSVMTLNVSENGWLLFDCKLSGGAWNDSGLTFNVTSGGATLENWNIKGNSSTNKAWATKCVKITGVSTDNPAAIAVWTYDANSGTYQQLDEIRLVTEAPMFTASATEGGTAKVNDSESIGVEPNTTATFTATANDGYLFVGWKTSADAETFVSQNATYTVTAYDEAVSLIAVFEAPFNGAGTASNPYQISSVSDLEKMATLFESNTFEGTYFSITSDIDATGFTGIGSASAIKSFGGSIIGNSRTISGLTTPLFGRLGDKSSISDLTVSGNVTSTVDYAGILVGYCKGTLTNVTASGSVSSTKQYVGGIAGYADNTMTNCTSSATVTCTYDSTTTLGHVGGLVGQYGTYTNPTMTGCSASGDVSGPGRVGGLVGDLYSTGSIVSCTASGNVTGVGNYVGGLVGEFSTEGTIENCSATGNVKGAQSVGGLVGYNDKQLKGGGIQITGCFASGLVEATKDNAGGIIGYTCREGLITQCEARNRKVVSAGTNVGRIVGNNTPSSWNGTKAFSDNVANANMTLIAAGVTCTLTDDQKGGTTIHGADMRMGDINKNGAMNIVDAQIAYDLGAGKYAAEKLSKILDLFGIGATIDSVNAVADVNDDGEVNAVDAFAIQYAVHNKGVFGVKE